jgi:hypothetical protein
MATRLHWSQRVAQWSVSAVLGLQALHLALLPSARESFADTGLPDEVRLLLAWSEVAAAVAFAIPRFVVTGGLLLALVLAAAAALHIYLGEAPPPAFVVYWAVIGTSIIHARPAADTALLRRY